MSILNYYTVSIKSYRFEEFNDEEIYRFKHKNIADEFCRIKQNEYMKNENLQYLDGKFYDMLEKWSYEIIGYIESMVIYDNIKEIS